MGFLQFIQLYGNTRDKFRILCFLARHPEARFDLRSFSVAHDGRPRDLSEGVLDLVTQGVVEEHPRGSSFYCLARAPEKRQPVLELAGMDLGQTQVLARLVGRPCLPLTPVTG